MTHSYHDNPFGILMYHRVARPTVGMPAPTWNVTPEQLRRQLLGLLARGYRPWPLRRAIASRRAGEPVPPRTFVVTFDDGYESVYDNAWPILKEISVPATIFIVTAYLGVEGPFPFDDWSAAGSPGVPVAAWKPLTTVHCEEMARQGLVEIGSHTHTHVDYYGQPEAFRRDLAQSLKVLNDAFGIEQAAFAYPFGRFGKDLIAAARACEVACALTAEQELILPHGDPLAWGRLYVDGNDTAARVAWKLSGWYTRLRRLWHWLHWSRQSGRPAASRRVGPSLPTSEAARAPKGMVPL